MWASKIATGLGGRAACTVGAASRTFATRVLAHSSEATTKATIRLEVIKSNIARRDLQNQLREIRHKTDLSNAKSVGPK